MAPKTKVDMPGVAEGMELVGVPTDDDVSAEDRVNVLLSGAMGSDSNSVSLLPILLKLLLNLMSNRFLL